MAFVRWSGKYVVHHPVLDAQHHYLKCRFDDLARCIVKQASVVAMQGVLDLFEIRIREHFSTEELLMLDAKYPGLEHHRDEHREFLMMLDVSRHVLLGARSEALGILLYFQREWLTHVCGSDRHCAEYLAQASAVHVGSMWRGLRQIKVRLGADIWSR